MRAMSSARWWLVLSIVVGCPAVSAAQAPRAVVITSVDVSVSVSGGATVVTIQANGPLPSVVRHSLLDPPRVYFDFPEVTPKASGMTQLPGAGVVGRARVALNSAEPLVTRVVLDLPALQPVRVDDAERQNGRIRVYVGAVSDAPSARAGAAAASESSPGKPSSTIPVVAVPAQAINPSAGTPTRAEGTVTRAPFAAALSRIEAQRALLASIEAGTNVDAGQLRFANAEFTELRQLIGVMSQQDVAVPVRELLVSSCTLGAAATKLRLDSLAVDTPAARRNAGSAAAGALMLLDRACASLSCSVQPR
jgi:hypothetical protein